MQEALQLLTNYSSQEPDGQFFEVLYGCLNDD